MNKKKAKKKVKKKVKSKKSKVKQIVSAKVLFHQKIHQIMMEHPEFECGMRGQSNDDEFGYVEADKVFRAYGDSMRNAGLTCIPVEENATLGRTAYMLTVKFQITDIETGYSEYIVGSGLGVNGEWSANTAATLALKQALLQTFMASWPQPEDIRSQVKRTAENVFGPASSIEDVRQLMDEYFSQVKEKKDGNSRNTKNRRSKK